MREKPTKRQLLIIIFFVVTVIALVRLDFIKNGPKARLIRDDLERELSLIEPLPQSVCRSHDSSSKPRQALVENSYTTEIGYDKIRAYYDVQLSKLGWQFHSEESLKDWGRDFGGRSVHYCNTFAKKIFENLR